MEVLELEFVSHASRKTIEQISKIRTSPNLHRFSFFITIMPFRKKSCKRSQTWAFHCSRFLILWPSSPCSLSYAYSRSLSHGKFEHWPQCCKSFSTQHAANSHLPQNICPLDAIHPGQFTFSLYSHLSQLIPHLLGKSLFIISSFVDYPWFSHRPYVLMP